MKQLLKNPQFLASFAIAAGLITALMSFASGGSHHGYACGYQEPSYQPSYSPSHKPSYRPTYRPRPSYRPSFRPSFHPSYHPYSTCDPYTSAPSYQPSYHPTYKPSPKLYNDVVTPTPTPTPSPSPSPAPTDKIVTPKPHLKTSYSTNGNSALCRPLVKIGACFFVKKEKSLYSLHNYTAQFSPTNLMSGQYRLKITYRDHPNKKLKLPKNYNYRVKVIVHNTTGDSVQTMDLVSKDGKTLNAMLKGGLQVSELRSNGALELQWDNDRYVAGKTDTNFEIDKVELERIGR